MICAMINFLILLDVSGTLMQITLPHKEQYGACKALGHLLPAIITSQYLEARLGWPFWIPLAVYHRVCIYNEHGSC